MTRVRFRSDSLQRLVERLEPGGRLVRTRRLRGGISARMDLLDIERAYGGRTKVTLRRFIPHDGRYEFEISHEHRILSFLATADIAAPRPLWLDAEGALFGVPAMALTYLPGNPLYTPRDTASWAEQLARALLKVHAVTPRTHDLSWLGTNLREEMRAELARREEQARRRSPLAREVHAALVRGFDRVAWVEPAFVHDDFWPGNTVWHRGQLTGVIDWSNAEVGDPRADVAQCRADIAISLGGAAADAFLEAYQKRADTALPDVWFFDLFRGLGALLYVHLWVDGYHDAGLTHLTLNLARARLGRFLGRALAASRGC